MDNILRNHISGRRLRAENKRHGPCRFLAGLNFQILMDNVKGVHLLPLVFMQTLTLNVKDGVRIQRHAFRFLHISRQIFLPVHLDLGNTVKHLIVVNVCEQFFQISRIFLIAVPNGLRDEIRKLTVTGEKPPSERDAVSLIVKLLRIDLVESVQLRIL